MLHSQKSLSYGTPCHSTGSATRLPRGAQRLLPLERRVRLADEDAALAAAGHQPHVEEGLGAGGGACEAGGQAWTHGEGFSFVPIKSEWFDGSAAWQAGKEAGLCANGRSLTDMAMNTIGRVTMYGAVGIRGPHGPLVGAVGGKTPGVGQPRLNTSLRHRCDTERNLGNQVANPDPTYKGAPKLATCFMLSPQGRAPQNPRCAESVHVDFGRGVSSMAGDCPGSGLNTVSEEASGGVQICPGAQNTPAHGRRGCCFPLVPRARIELATPRFSVACSTN